MNELINISVPSNALEVFTCDKAEAVVSAIEVHARSVVPDLTTLKGRKAIASNAAAVARSKVALDNLGKDLVSGWKSKSKAVDTERKMMRDRLSLLRDEVRQPLTDWEEADRQRAIVQAKALKLEQDHDDAIAENELFDREREYAKRDAELKAREEAIAEKARLAEEAQERARQVAADLVAEEARLARAETERAELEEQAKLDRIEAVEQEKQNQIRIAKVAQEKLEQEKLDAEAAQRKAENDAIEAKAREKALAEQAKEREIKAAADAKQAEIDRQEQERQDIEIANAKREANRSHTGKIRKEAKTSLMGISGITEDLARLIVKAINADKIKNVTINY